ncbi:IclR family transcriptional regulator [Natrialba aegyptia]|uniref:IclR family transcriptional regulator n=1 Tax=Natrialba aegyptia DSM 13077 TaxID=1227491 RepID=M0AJ23_9EURY|nr:IclR family transcriptional regulator [Natrialba aegyptia]ELY98376.1 IclR family transcriptional regulator [Natrialba aegyptia DSM 13077]
MTNGPNRIKAVENAFEIVENVGKLDGCRVRELADHMDLPKSTAHIYLKTLEDTGYVVRRNEQYQLSLRFLNVGGQVRHNNSLYQVGRNEVDDLARTISEVATIGCEENGYRVMLYRTEPTGAIFNNASTGEYTRMHWTALGKAILSQKSDEEITEIADRHGLPRATEHTIVDRDALLDEIETIRLQGYAIEDEERVKGVKSVAVQVESDGETPDAAISAAGPKHEFTPERIQEELLPALQNTANVVELKTKHY